MPHRTVHVSAAARLHFGLLSFGRTHGRQFGGVGAMVAPPHLRLQITQADALECSGPLRERAADVARRVGAVLAVEPRCRIAILEAPRQHIGLGVGTQLSLAVGAGLCALWDRPLPNPAELARWLGRGQRSAIGTYGFLHGGLLVEAGKAPGQTLSPLLRRLYLPESWRFVLVCPRSGEGLSGTHERDAFAGLPPVPRRVTAQLCRELFLGLLPAAIEGSFSRFSRSLYRYGRLAGACFAQRQGGPYCGAQTAALVERLRKIGVEGVAQTSWGPTLLGLVPDQGDAEALVGECRDWPEAQDIDFFIAAPYNRPAEIVVEDSRSPTLSPAPSADNPA